MSWNVNSWAKMTMGANRSLLLRQGREVLALQEPRTAVQLPGYTAVQGTEPGKSNAALLILDSLEPRVLVAAANIAAASTRFRGGVEVVFTSLYVRKPLDEQSRYARQVALDLAREVTDRGGWLVLCGDLNALIGQPYPSQVRRLLANVVRGDSGGRRAGGLAREIDFVFTNARIARLAGARVMEGLSDHAPICFKLRGLRPTPAPRTQPFRWCSEMVAGQVLDQPHVSSLEAWKRILGAKRLVARKRFKCLEDLDPGMTYAVYLAEYVESYKLELGRLSSSRFSDPDTALWFQTLKRLTKYDQWAKRDGSFANSCTQAGKRLVGREFRRAALKWYASLCPQAPRLRREERFPGDLAFSEAAFEKKGRFQKAVSVDCVGSFLFDLPRLGPEREAKLRLLRAIFTPEFWEMPEAKTCLVGRLVLLNKDHPHTPELGRFRPIRICSNVVKALESWLLPPLQEWGSRILREQFGFVAGLGCEPPRQLVFGEMARRLNLSESFWVVQIDLSSAYNTVNLAILEGLVRREAFWTSQEQQLWRFLATNATTWFEGEEVPEINGLPQGSLLSPLLFDLYLDGLLALARRGPGMVVAYADDLIGVFSTKGELEDFIQQATDFFSRMCLKLNGKKSDVLRFGCAAGCRDVSGIPVRTSAKYLGVTYDRALRVGHSLKALEQKIAFCFHKLYRFLRLGSFRLRYNLWQVFVAPLFRMVLSIAGEPGSERARLCFEAIRKAMRKSLKRFTLAPRASDVAFFDFLTKSSDYELNQILSAAKDKAEGRVGARERSAWEYASHVFPAAAEEGRIASFHPQTSEILRSLNRYRCKQHAEAVLSANHLIREHIGDPSGSLQKLLTSPERRGTFADLLLLLQPLKGPKSGPAARPPERRSEGTVGGLRAASSPSTPLSSHP